MKFPKQEFAVGFSCLAVVSNNQAAARDSSEKSKINAV
jgi:hypothetical protein